SQASVRTEGKAPARTLDLRASAYGAQTEGGHLALAHRRALRRPAGGSRSFDRHERAVLSSPRVRWMASCRRSLILPASLLPAWGAPDERRTCRQRRSRFHHVLHGRGALARDRLPPAAGLGAA